MASPAISPPPPEVTRDIIAANADRFPEKFTLGPLLGDGRVTVTLPIILGVPTGTIPIPEGATEKRSRGARAWSDLVGAALGFRSETDINGANLVSDCILYPKLPIWREWCETWPALDAPAFALLKKKLAREAACIESPDDDELPPGVTLGPRGVLRILKPAPGIVHHVAVEPPTPEQWRAYLRMGTDPAEDIGRRTRDLVDAITGNAIPAVLDRWPGLVVSLAKTGAYLAGAGAEGALGNW